MTTSNHGDDSAASAARKTFLHLCERLRDRIASGNDPAGALVRVEARMDGIVPLNWLHAQKKTTHYYWADREGDFEMAGIGEADVVVPEDGIRAKDVFTHMRRRLSLEWPNLRYYGGFRFCERSEAHRRWRNFTAYRFIVPRMEVVRQGKKTWLACSVRAAATEAAEADLRVIRSLIDHMVFPGEPLPCPVPPVTGRTDLPDREGWTRMVEGALDAMAHHKLEKVVLARETEFQFDCEGPLDPIGMLRRLLRHTNRSYEFCFHPSATRAFLGASPERLFHRRNVYLESEALAGTRPRGGTDAADKALGNELLSDDKELREHRFVVRTLREHLKRFCVTMNYDDAPSLRRLRNVQHLYTYMEGILKHHDADAALIEALHPTPAVGGVPRDAALKWIAASEPFDRGVYAAPVGWVSFDESEFCVGIRSGLIEGNTLSLYSGAGIVPGSSAKAEWDEIENKMSNFLEALYDGRR